jgi:hypothetical protein
MKVITREGTNVTLQLIDPKSKKPTEAFKGKIITDDRWGGYCVKKPFDNSDEIWVELSRYTKLITNEGILIND